MKHLFSILLAGFAVLAPITAASAQDAQQIIDAFKNEPSIEDTQAAAVEFSGLDSDRLESLYVRAGASRVLPKSFYYEMQYRDQDRDQPQRVYAYNSNQDLDSIKVTDYEQDTKYIQHKVRAQWDLSGLVYNSDQVRVVSQMNTAAKTRDSLLKNVTKTYFQRRKAQIDMVTNPPKDVTSKLNAELKIQEYTATLDAMTGGWFSQNIRK